MAPVSSIGALNCNISYAACCGLQRSRTAVAYCACRNPVRPWPAAACRHPVRPRHAAACGEFLSGVYCNKPRPNPIIPAPIQSSPPQSNPPRPKKNGTHCNASHSLNVVRQSVPTHLAIHANTFVYDHARRCMVKESVWPSWLACATRRRHWTGRPAQ